MGGLAAPASAVVSAVADVSAFSLRLPDVVGGILFFAGLFLLGRLAFGDSPWLPLTVALGGLNPFALDVCSMAAGRGLGLGCWTLAAYLTARWVADGRPIPSLAGALLGLAAAADPQQCFGVAALEIGLLVCLFATKGRGGIRIAMAEVAPLCLISWAIPALAYWVHPPFAFSDRTAARFLDGLKALATASALHVPSSTGFWPRLGWIAIATTLVGLCAAALLSGGRERRLAMLFSVAGAAVGVLIWAVPRVGRDRWFGAEGLAFTLPLISFGGALLARRIHAKAGAVVVLGVVAAFAWRFQTHAYYGYEAQAATRDVIARLEARERSQPKARLLVSAPSSRSPDIDVYRKLRGINWLAQAPDHSLECAADFYYLPVARFARMGSLGLRVIADDARAGTVLAEMGTAARARIGVLRELGFADEPQCNAGVMAEARWVDSNLYGSARYYLRDIDDRMLPDRWRWTYERPAFLLHQTRREGVRFRMDFLIHGLYFRDKLPVELEARVNGREIGRRRYTSLEQQSFDAAVPAEALREDGVALVETSIDRYYVAPEDRQKLGYLFIRGGFVD